MSGDGGASADGVAPARTQVGIVGAGPAGLLLAHLLHRAGVDAVVVEARDRAYVEGRIRAGVLEGGTAETLREAGVGGRMDREGLVHGGIELRFAGRGHRVDLAGLTGGRTVTVYGQHEVVRDLVAARLGAGLPLVFGAEGVALHGLADGEGRPRITWTGADGSPRALECDLVAGCDGFHGASRRSVPRGALKVYERAYPFAWLGVLAEAPPPHEELIYARHERGFALASMRSPTISRLYVQCPPDDEAEHWSDDRVWSELTTRLEGSGAKVTEGRILQKGVTPMRSFVAEPMRHGRLFLCGDAAHIVPPTGAKGMNLAVADVRVLARAMAARLREGRSDLLDAYSATCLARVWKVQRFSWWMTAMLHRFDGDDPFEHRVQLAELDYVARSRAAATTLAENYVGLPFDA